MTHIAVGVTTRRSGAHIRRCLAILAREALGTFARVVEIGQIVALRAELAWRRSASGAHRLLVEVAPVEMLVEDEAFRTRLDGEVRLVEA